MAIGMEIDFYTIFIYKVRPFTKKEFKKTASKPSFNNSYFTWSSCYFTFVVLGLKFSC